MHTNHPFGIFVLASIGWLSVATPRARAQAGDAAAPAPAAVQLNLDHTGLGKLEWQFAAPSAVFDDKTALGMIDRMHEMVIHHIEFSAGQSISAALRETKVGPDLPDSGAGALTAKLASTKMDIVSYDAGELPKDDTDVLKIFQLAKKLKVKDIVFTAPEKSLGKLDKLAKEYDVNVAIANRIKPASMWSADELVKDLAGCSDHIGICVRVVAFKRSGEDPAAAIRKLAGHIMECHLADINAAGEEVVLGNGTIDLPAVLKAFKDQKFKGIFTVECHIGTGDEMRDKWIRSINKFSDQVTVVAAG